MEQQIDYTSHFCNGEEVWKLVCSECQGVNKEEARRKRKEYEEGAKKILVFLSEAQKWRKIQKENERLKYELEGFEILVYKAIEIFSQDYHYFSKEFNDLPLDKKILEFHKILNGFEEEIRGNSIS